MLPEHSLPRGRHLDKEAQPACCVAVHGVAESLAFWRSVAGRSGYADTVPFSTV